MSQHFCAEWSSCELSRIAGGSIFGDSLLLVCRPFISFLSSTVHVAYSIVPTNFRHYQTVLRACKCLHGADFDYGMEPLQVCQAIFHSA